MLYCYLYRELHAPSVTFELGVFSCYTCNFHVTCVINKTFVCKNLALNYAVVMANAIILNYDSHKMHISFSVISMLRLN